MDSVKTISNDATWRTYDSLNYGSTDATQQPLQAATVVGNDDTHDGYAVSGDYVSSSFQRDTSERERLTKNRILETTPKVGSHWFSKSATHRRVMLSLVAGLILCVLIMALTPKPIVSSMEGAVRVAFPMADRARYGDSASKFIRADLFHPNLLFRSEREPTVSSDANFDPFLKVPFPTGAFWMNLVMAPAADGFSFPIVAYPYAFTWSETILQVSYPYLRRRVDDYSIRDVVQPDISFGVVGHTLNRQVIAFDPLSVTLRFSTGPDSSAGSNGFWETYLIHGSPYITTKHVNTKPVLKALSTFIKVSCLFDADSNHGDEVAGDANHDLCHQSDVSIDQSVDESTWIQI